jgi:hypothetical protein
MLKWALYILALLYVKALSWVGSGVDMLACVFSVWLSDLIMCFCFGVDVLIVLDFFLEHS